MATTVTCLFFYYLAAGFVGVAADRRSLLDAVRRSGLPAASSQRLVHSVNAELSGSPASRPWNATRGFGSLSRAFRGLSRRDDRASRAGLTAMSRLSLLFKQMAALFEQMEVAANSMADLIGGQEVYEMATAVSGIVEAAQEEMRQTGIEPSPDILGTRLLMELAQRPDIIADLDKLLRRIADSDLARVLKLPPELRMVAQAGVLPLFRIAMEAIGQSSDGIAAEAKRLHNSQRLKARRSLRTIDRVLGHNASAVGEAIRTLAREIEQDGEIMNQMDLAVRKLADSELAQAGTFPPDLIRAAKKGLWPLLAKLAVMAAAPYAVESRRVAVRAAHGMVRDLRAKLAAALHDGQGR